MDRIWATISIVRPGEAFVESTTTAGEWRGGGLVAVRSGNREDLFEAGYAKASQNAAAHGATLDRFTWAA